VQTALRFYRHNETMLEHGDEGGSREIVPEQPAKRVGSGNY
jgi:hypothetical protein